MSTNADLLHDIAGFQIDLLDAIRDGVIGDAKAAQKGWDLAWLVAGLAIGVVAGALLPELEVGAIAGLVVEGSVGAGAGAATTAVQTWWREHHLPGTPPDIAAAARGASETMDDTVTAQTGLLMRLTLELAKSKGLVDPQKLDPLPVPMPLDPQHSGNCSGKKYAEQVYDWLAQAIAPHRACSNCCTACRNTSRKSPACRRSACNRRPARRAN